MDIRTAARLAKAVYTGQRHVDGWEMQHTTGTIALFKRPGDTTQVIAYRGTDVRDMSDLATDLQLFITGGTLRTFLMPLGPKVKDRCQQAVDYARRAVGGSDTSDPSPLTIHVGHSLGGTCALRACYATGGQCFAFEPYVPPRMPWSDLLYRPGMTICGNKRDPIFAETLLDRWLRPGSRRATWVVVNRAGSGPDFADRIGHGLEQWMR